MALILRCPYYVDETVMHVRGLRQAYLSPTWEELVEYSDCVLLGIVA